MPNENEPEPVFELRHRPHKGRWRRIMTGTFQECSDKAHEMVLASPPGNTGEYYTTKLESKQK